MAFHFGPFQDSPVTLPEPANSHRGFCTGFSSSLTRATVTSMVTNNYITTITGNGFSKIEEEFIKRHHKFEVKENQCSSSLVKHIKAPVHLNYSSIVMVHPEVIDGRPGTLVIESFVVDVPDGNTKDETCYFVLIKCNLKTLADVSKHLALQDRTEPIERM